MRQGFLVGGDLGFFIFASIPKCGQHTLQSMCTANVARCRVPEAKAIAFIREPIDRLKSAYHFFISKGYKLDRKKIGSYESFVDWALESNEEHIRPQHTFCEEYYNFVKLECMSDVLTGITGSRVIALNTAPRYNETNATYRAEELRKLYAKDFYLYESALSGLSIRGF